MDEFESLAKQMGLKVPEKPDATSPMAAVPPKGSRKSAYTQAELEDALRRAGFKDEALVGKMGAIGMAEAALDAQGRARMDSFNPGVGPGGRPTKERSAGPWQINTLAHPEYDKQRLLSDIDYNAKAAHDIFYKKKQGLKAWGAYTDGRYRKFYKGKPVSATSSSQQVDTSPRPDDQALFDEMYGQFVASADVPSSVPSPTMPKPVAPIGSTPFVETGITDASPVATPVSDELKKTVSEGLQSLKVRQGYTGSSDIGQPAMPYSMMIPNGQPETPESKATSAKYDEWRTAAGLDDTPETRKEYNDVVVPTINAQSQEASDLYNKDVDAYNRSLPQVTTRRGVVPQQPQTAQRAASQSGDSFKTRFAFSGDAIKDKDEFASRAANALGFDFDVVRQYITEKGLSSGQKDSTRWKGRESNFVLDAEDIATIRAMQGQYEKANRRQETQKATAENQINEHINAGEIASVAQLLAAKDVGIKEIKGRPIDDLIQEERAAFQRFKDELRNDPNEYNRILQSEDARRRLLAGESADQIVADRWAAANQIQIDRVLREIEDKKLKGFADREAEQKRISQTYGTLTDSTRPMARPSEFALNFFREFAKLPGQAANLIGMGADAMSPAGIDPKINPFVQFGEAWKSRIDETKNKDLRDEMVVGDFAQALAQLAQQTITIPFTGGASVLLPLGQAAESQYLDAAKGKATRNQRIWAATVGGLAAVPDAWLKFNFLKSLAPAARLNFFDNFVKNLATGLASQMSKNEARQATIAFVTELVAKAPVGYFTEKYQERTEDIINKAWASKAPGGLSYAPDKTWSEIITPTEREMQGYEAAGLVGLLGAGGGVAAERIQQLSDVELANSESVIQEAFGDKLTQGQLAELLNLVNQERQRRDATAQPEPPSDKTVVADKKGNTFTVLEDQGEKLKVQDEKGVISVRNADRLTPIDEKSKVQEPPAPVVEGEDVSTTKVEGKNEAPVEAKPEPSIRYHEKMPQGLPREAPLTGQKGFEIVGKGETKGAGRTVTVNEQEITLTPEQESRWVEEVEKPLAKAKEYVVRAKKSKNRVQIEEASSHYKGEAMRVAAIKREITGLLTTREKKAKQTRDASNFIGKEVSVGGRNAKVIGNPFGRVKVEFADGSTQTVDANKVEPLAAKSGIQKYPLASRDEWYGEANYETAGGRMVEMSPDEYLSQVRPLVIDEESRENIDLLKQHIVDGKTLDPLKIFSDGKEDGRHRAIAAKELGITAVPVIRFDAPAPKKPAKQRLAEKAIPTGLQSFETAKEGEIYQDKGRILVRGDGNRGVGDRIFDSMEDAKAYVAAEEKRAANRAKQDAEAARVHAEIAAKDAEREAEKKRGLEEFTAKMSPMQRGKVETALAKLWTYKGKATSTKKIIEGFAAEGEIRLTTEEVPKIKDMTRQQMNRATNEQQAAHERRQKEAGTKTVYSVNDLELGKIAYDYAKFLKEQAEPAKQRLAEKAIADPVPANPRNVERAETFAKDAAMGRDYQFQFTEGEQVEYDHAKNGPQKAIIVSKYIEDGEARYMVYPPGKKAQLGAHVWVRESDLRSRAKSPARERLAKKKGEAKEQTFPEFLKERIGEQWYVSDRPIKRRDAAGEKRIKHSDYKRLEEEFKAMKSPQSAEGESLQMAAEDPLTEGLAETVGKQRNAWAAKVGAMFSGRRPGGPQVIMDGTPAILRKTGLPAKAIYTTADVIEKLRGDHGLNQQQVTNIFNDLVDPIMVFDSATVTGSKVVVTSQKDYKGDSIIVAILPNGRVTVEKPKQTDVSANIVTSSYGKTNEALQRWIDGNLLLYRNTKKGRERWHGPYRLQLPAGISRRSSPKRTILTQDDFVNTDDSLKMAAEDFGQPSDYTFKESDYRSTVVEWAKGKWGDAIAPNGKPVYQNFVRFFGDSKMVDERGNPLIAYHGTNREFDTFREDVGRANDEGFYGKGFYFTFQSDPEWRNVAKGEAGYYGKNIIPAYLKIERPFDISKLSEYKGVHNSYMGYQSMVFLRNIAEQFPKVASNIMVQKTGEWKDGEAPITDVSSTILPELFEKYDKAIKFVDVYDGDEIKYKTAYTKEEERVHARTDGTEFRWMDQDTFGRYRPDMSDAEMRQMAIIDAIEKYEGIKARYHPEGFMTRHPEITEAIKAQGYDGIVQSMQGDEAVVFNANQIKSADRNRGTFDPNEDSILKMQASDTALSRFKDVQYAHTQTLLEGAKSEIKEVDGQTILELNEEAAELARRTQAEMQQKAVTPFYGSTYTAPMLRKLASTANKVAAEYLELGYTPAQVKSFRTLAANFIELANQAHGVAYVFDFALPHETHHKLVLDALNGKPFPKEVLKSLEALDIWTANPTITTPDGVSKSFKSAYPRLSKQAKAFEIAAMLETGEIVHPDKNKFLDLFARGILEVTTELDPVKFARILDYASQASDTGRDQGKSADTEADGSLDEPTPEKGEGDGQRSETAPGTREGTADKPRTEKERKVAAFSRILGEDYFYDPQSHDETEIRAAQLISDKGTQQAIHDALYGTPSAEGMRVVYWELERLTGALDNALAEGNEAEAAAYAEAAADLSAKIVQRQVAGGQETEIAKMLVPLSPEASIIAAQKMVEFVKGEGAKLTPDQTEKITRLANELKDARADIAKQEKKVKTLEKKIDKLKEDRPQTKTAKMLRQYRKRKPVLIKELQDLFPEASVFNGESYSLKMVAASPEYLYHGTGEGAFRRIRELGLVPQVEGKYLYFADSEEYAESYASRKGNPFGNRVLRIKFDDSFTHDEATGLKGDYKTLQSIPPENLEIKVNGEWMPIQAYSDPEIGLLMAASGLTDQQYAKLVEYAGGEILENKPYKTLIAELDQFTGDRELSKEVHAEAVDSLRSERGTMSDEAKSALKTRNEHYREADKILKPKGENQNVKKEIDKDWKKLNNQNVRELSRVGQRVWAKTGDPMLTMAVERLNTDPKTINDVLKDVQKSNPDMSIAEAANFVRKAKQMLTATKAEIAEERDKLKGILPEQRKELQAAKVAKQKATMKLNRFLASLADDSNAIKRFNNDMRAKFVSNWGTQLFNVIQAFPTNGAEAMLDLFTATMKATGLNIGETPDINAKDFLLPMTYIFGNNKQLAEFALAEFPEQFFEVHSGLLGDIDIDPVALAENEKGISKGIHWWFDKNQKLNNKLAQITGAKLQEMHFRNAMVAGTFDQIIRRKSGGKETLQSAIENGTVTKYVTEQEADFAAKKALRVTFAALIDDKPGKAMKRAYDKFDSYLPIFLNPVTYARFTYTTTKVMVANPILFGALDAKALGGKGYDTRSLASGILGWSGIAVAYGLLANFGGDDDEWYTLKFGDTVFDIRRSFPLSTYFYMAHLIKNFKDGKPAPELKELFEGFASLETDYFRYGPGLELKDALVDRYSGTNEWSDVGASGARLAGNFFAGFLRFFKPMRDVLAQFDEEENKLRFYNNSGQDKFVQEIARSLPLVARAYGAEVQQDATGKDIGMPFPFGRLAGINIVHPSFLKPEQSTATKWAMKLFRYEGSSGKMSEDDRRAYQMRRTIKNAVRRGTPMDAVQGQLQAYRKRFGERSFGRLKEELQMSEMAAQIKYQFGMTDENDVRNLRKVWAYATDAEKVELRGVLRSKKNRTPAFNQEFGLSK